MNKTPKYEIVEVSHPYWVQIEGRDLTARYKETELVPASAIDRLGEIV